MPRLANGPAASYPRVYGIALELISHVDGRVDAVSLNGFIASYQTVTPLKLGELWAVPIMLRLALIENLRRVAARVAIRRRDGDIADDWAERMVRVVEQNPTDLILVMADMARANPPLSGAFLAEMTRHLQGQSPYFAFANSWLENRLAEQGLTTGQLILAEGQNQAADQVSIGNSINSLRFLSSNDWRDFVETHSLVEQILQGDPADEYTKMDFATRDRYRHAVEEIAKRSPQAEIEIATQAIQLAMKGAIGSAQESGGRSHSFSPAVAEERQRDRHVGYYLIDEGRPALERKAVMQRSPQLMVSKICRRFPLLFYVAGVLLITIGATAAFADWSREDLTVLSVVFLTVPLLVCVGHFAIGVMLWLTTILVKPRRLPRWTFQTESRRSIARWWSCRRCFPVRIRCKTCSTISKCATWRIATKIFISPCLQTSRTRPRKSWPATRN